MSSADDKVSGVRDQGSVVSGRGSIKIVMERAGSFLRGRKNVEFNMGQVARLRLGAVAFILVLHPLLLTTACGGRQGASFIVAGSTSVQPYVEILAERYAIEHHDVLIDIQGGGSSAGIQAAVSDTAAIGMSSRNLRGDELDLWWVEITKDGLAVVVHPDNPVTDLSLDQIRGIYSEQFTNWSELGGPDARIHVITREEGSGTRGAFEEMVMLGTRITPRAIVQNSNGAVRQLVADDRYSIGFVSLGLVDIGERPVRAVRIDGVAASRENVINGSYTLFRSFLFVAREEPPENVMSFINFILSPEGRRILASEGLIPE